MAPQLPNVGQALINIDGTPTLVNLVKMKEPTCLYHQSYNNPARDSVRRDFCHHGPFDCDLVDLYRFETIRD